MTTTPDFNQFGEELWEVANVFRDDALHAHRAVRDLQSVSLPEIMG